jgi:hypothetical protein
MTDFRSLILVAIAAGLLLGVAAALLAPAPADEPEQPRPADPAAPMMSALHEEARRILREASGE